MDHMGYKILIPKGSLVIIALKKSTNESFLRCFVAHMGFILPHAHGNKEVIRTIHTFNDQFNLVLFQ